MGGDEERKEGLNRKHKSRMSWPPGGGGGWAGGTGEEVRRRRRAPVRGAQGGNEQRAGRRGPIEPTVASGPSQPWRRRIVDSSAKQVWLARMRRRWAPRQEGQKGVGSRDLASRTEAGKTRPDRLGADPRLMALSGGGGEVCVLGISQRQIEWRWRDRTKKTRGRNILNL